LGEAVPEGDAQAVLKALGRLYASCSSPEKLAGMQEYAQLKSPENIPVRKGNHSY